MFCPHLRAAANTWNVAQFKASECKRFTVRSEKAKADRLHDVPKLSNQGSVVGQRVTNQN